MMPNRLPLALGALAAGSILLSGCAASSAASAPEASVAAAANIADCDPAENTITATYGLMAAEAMAIATANLQETYPELTIDATPPSTSDYNELTKTVVADIAVGNRPDLIMTGLGQLQFWVDTYSPAAIDVSALRPSYKTQFLGAGTVDGTVYLATNQISATVLLVNQDALDSADAGDAKDIETLDDLVAAAEKVTADTGKPSVTIPTEGLPDWFSQALVQGSGETYVNDDGTAGFGSEKAIEALSIWSTLKNKDLELGVAGNQDAIAQFVGGNAAFLVWTTSGIATIQEGIGDAFNWMPVDLPSVEGDEEGALPAGGNGWIVLSEDACRAAYSNALIAELLSPEAVSAASGTSYSYIPVDNEAGDALLASDAATKQLTYAWSYDKPLTPWGGFAGKDTMEVFDTVRLMAQKLQSGADATETVNEAVTNIDLIVSE
ncbi:extracellular solute-binding protein [Cryobacterium sp. Hh7]|uniref:extracellular solute-binding protein n=1 Tax=Cryobacterium sp. Hh7 TaxID=1259159 RepID=UPI00141B69A7|nr:extracellular solute-binding protein [Cryobacterium sp. Hh7]